MNGKIVSVAVGVAGTLLFGGFLAHNQNFDLQLKKETVAIKEVAPTIVAMNTATTYTATQPAQPANPPPAAPPPQKTTKTRAS